MPKWVIVLIALFLALQVVGYGAVAFTEGTDHALALLLANISPFGTSNTAAQLPDFQAKKCTGKMKTEAVTSSRKFFWIFTYTYTETKSYCLNAEQSAGRSVDPVDGYRAFRGRMPTPEAMLRNTGLA